VFEFNRNTVLAANNFFNNRQGAPRPTINRNQYGASLGGPIIKDRTFFFATIEWQRQRQGVIQNRQVYTETMRRGIFRYNTQRANSTSDVDSAGNPLVPFGTIDLLTVDPTRTGFDTVFLPKLLAVMPPPNNYDIGDGMNLGGYRYTTSRSEDYQQYLGKIDHQLSNNHQLALSYSNWRLENPQPAQLNGYPAEGFTEIRRGGSIRLISTLSPRITNELSIGSNVRWSIRPILNRDQETPAGNIMLQVWGDGAQGGTSGNNNINRGLQNNPAVNVGFSDNLSWIKTKHTFSIGGELWYQMMNRTVGSGWPIIRTTNSSNPANVPQQLGLNANDRSRAQQLVNDLTGSVGTVSQNFYLTSTGGYTPYAGNYQQLRQLEWAAYFQDIWKWSPQLTLNLGIRFEMLHPGWIANGAFIYPKGGVDGALGIQGPTGRPTEWDFATDKGRGIMRTDWNNFAPTVGFSWDPFGKGDTTVSGSYGIGYDRSMMVIYGNFSGSNYGANTAVQLTPFMRLSDPRFYRDVLPIRTPQLFAPLGFTRDSRADAVDENIGTPYVQSWTFRISRQIGTDWKVDVAYVGNHAVGLWRAENLNQIEIRNNGFLDAFLIAQRNLAANRDPLRGESLGRLEPLFRLVPSSQYNLITEGQVAALANFLDTTTLQTNVRGGLIERAGLPVTFFRFNPQVQNLNLVGNRTHSTWNAMKLTVGRRLRSGLYAQLNYTLSKGFTDSIPDQNLYGDEYRDIRNHRLDKALQEGDSTHVATLNWIYELPFGSGKRFMSSANRIVDGFLGGWQFNGIWNYASGRPFSITTGRQNLTQTESSTPNFTGALFHMSNVIKGNQITTLTPEQRAQFSNPGPGEAGQLPRRLIRGPGFANLDLSMFK
ncbi:MAG: TonB-dependent receptor, partial [Acidobacteria bacterium]|nr:TonB-dependent receptor [Acidobacteriota bacterium]